MLAVLAMSVSAAESEQKAAAVTLSDVHLSIKDSQGSSLTETIINYPKGLKKTPDLHKSEVLQLSFVVSDPTVEQVFVRMSHEEHPYVKTFATPAPLGNVFIFKLALGTKGTPRLPKGKYSMEVVVAGNKVAPLVWEAGDVNVVTATEYKPTVEVELVEELQYSFPPAPTKPPALLATIFSAAVIAPAVFLLTAWGVIGVNVKAFSPSPAALVFHASIAAMFALFIKFWIDITMFETLYYGFPLAVIMFVSGNYALSHLKYGL